MYEPNRWTPPTPNGSRPPALQEPGRLLRGAPPAREPWRQDRPAKKPIELHPSCLRSNHGDCSAEEPVEHLTGTLGDLVGHVIARQQTRELADHACGT